MEYENQAKAARGSALQTREQPVLEIQITRLRQARMRIDDELSRFGASLDRLVQPTPMPVRDGVAKSGLASVQIPFETQFSNEISELEGSLERLAQLASKLERAV